jgi:hypothetical protein
MRLLDSTDKRRAYIATKFLIIWTKTIDTDLMARQFDGQSFEQFKKNVVRFGMSNDAECPEESFVKLVKTFESEHQILWVKTFIRDQEWYLVFGAVIVLTILFRYFVF